MSLLYPDFLWALLLNIIPVIIHLFNLQKHETIYFSDLTLLKSIEKETKNISRLKNILILLLRIMMISSLVLAFCVPQNKNESLLQNKNNGIVGVYLDNSFSMLRTSNENSLLNNAKDDLMSLIENLPEKTKYILTTNHKKANKPYPISKEDLITKITDLKVSSNSLKFNEVINLQKEQSKNNISKSYWFSDLHKKDFNLIDNNIDSNFPINLIHYQSNNKDNLSIDSVWFLDKNRRVNKEEELNVKITNYSNNEIEFQTKLSINNSELITQSLDLIKPNQTTIISFHYKMKTKGLKNGLVSITDANYNDQLFDDNYYFSYTIGKEYEVVHLFENDFNIKKPLEILYGSVEKTKFKSIDIKKGFTAEELVADLVILDGISTFNNELINGLTNKKNGDQNLVLIPSNKQPNQLNKLIGKFNLKLLSIDSSENILDDKTIDNEFFKSVFGKKEKNINLPFFKNNSNIKTGNSAITLLSFENNKPLLIKSNENGNKLFIFTSSLHSSKSNLTNHALFVPLFLKIKEDCSNDFTKQFKIDNLPNLKLNNFTQQSGQLIIVDKIKSPDFSFFPTLSNNQGYSLINCQGQITKNGHFYIMNEDSILDGFSTNYSREESEMSFYSKDEFVSIIKKSSLQNYVSYFDMNANENNNIFNKKQTDTQYWKYFVILALIFIALEITLIKLTE